MIFFEPLKQSVASPIRYTLHRGLSWIDEKFYRLEMSMRDIPLLEDEYHHSDYQRQFGGIDPRDIEKVLKEDDTYRNAWELKEYCQKQPSSA